MFRDLKASEVECRVGMQGASGLTLLLYKDARVDMSILDETVGQENWQCKFYEFKGILFCSLGIRVGGEWIWKDDAGSESNTEAEKGNASDARKRAAVCWGIGRELYSAPFIWIKKDDYTLNDKGKLKDSFSVKSIEIKDKIITALEIVNNNTRKVVYTYGKKTPDVPFPEVEANRTAPAVVPPSPAALNPQKTAVEPVKPITPANSPNLDEERQAAINFVVMQGKKAGFTLGNLYKTDRAAYNELAANPQSLEMAKAITIINEWVGGRK
jgi:hypothetical protein